MTTKSSYWFAATLLAGLFFLWYIVSVIEAGEAHAGWVWGLLIFGVITIVAAVMSVLTFFAQGGRVDKRSDLLRTTPSAAPRSSYGAALQGSGRRLVGNGDAPRASSGRSLL